MKKRRQREFDCEVITGVHFLCQVVSTSLMLIRVYLYPEVGGMCSESLNIILSNSDIKFYGPNLLSQQ